MFQLVASTSDFLARTVSYQNALLNSFADFVANSK